MRLPAAFFILACMAMPVLAVTPGEMLPNAQLEARARHLSAQLRCLVCQNQSIDDSDATLAGDLRQLVRERVTAGDSDDEVLAYLVARYGDFILLRPPFRPGTFLLWSTPVLAVLLGGAGIAWAAAQRRGLQPQADPLSAADKDRLAELLNPPARKPKR